MQALAQSTVFSNIVAADTIIFITFFFKSRSLVGMRCNIHVLHNLINDSHFSILLKIQHILLYLITSQ